MAETQHATTTAAEHAPAGGDSALGLDATGWVAVVMLTVIGIMLWKRVPAVIGGMLDSQIAAIRATLDDAAALRTEAETLKARMEARLSASDAEAKAIVDAAKAEAAMLVAKAETDSAALIVRRRAAAEAKIAVAERAAIAKVRGAVVSAAVDAARTVIVGQTGAAEQARLADQAIADLDARLN